MLIGSQLKNAQVECLTSTQIAALHANDCVDGRIVFDTTNKKLFFYNTTTNAWVELGTKDIDDLNNYYTKTALDAAGTGRYTKTETIALSTLTNYLTTAAANIVYQTKSITFASAMDVSTTGGTVNQDGRTITNLTYGGVVAGTYRMSGTVSDMLLQTYGATLHHKYTTKIEVLKTSTSIYTAGVFQKITQTETQYQEGGATTPGELRLFGSDNASGPTDHIQLMERYMVNRHAIDVIFTLSGTENITVVWTGPDFAAYTNDAAETFPGVEVWGQVTLEKLPNHTSGTLTS